MKENNFPVAEQIKNDESTATVNETSVKINENSETVNENSETVNESNLHIFLQESALDLTDQLTNELKLNIYSRSKIVKYLSIIDMFFLVLNFGFSLANKNFFWLFIFLFPLCVCGYYGSKDYKKKYLLAYILYLTILSIYYLIFSLVSGYILILIIFFIESYFLLYTIRLYKYLNYTPDDILISLRSGWNPNNLVYYYI